MLDSGPGRWQGERGASSFTGGSRPKEIPLLQYCRLFEDKYQWAKTGRRVAVLVLGEDARQDADD